MANSSGCKTSGKKWEDQYLVGPGDLEKILALVIRITKMAGSKKKESNIDQFSRSTQNLPKSTFKIWIGTLYPKFPPICCGQWLKPSANWLMLLFQSRFWKPPTSAIAKLKPANTSSTITWYVSSFSMEAVPSINIHTPETFRTSAVASLIHAVVSPEVSIWNWDRLIGELFEADWVGCT